MNSTEVADAVRALLAARSGAGVFDPVNAAFAPEGPGDACAIQAEVAAALGPVGGWKIGTSAPDAEAFHAPLPASGVLPSPARLTDDGSRMRGIEVEIAYRLATDLPARAEPYDRAEVSAAVDALLPVIEVVETRFVDRDAASPMWLLADNQSHGELILGEPVLDWQTLAVAEPHVRITFDGGIVLDRVCRNAGGHPFDMVVRLANQLGDHCGGLRAGQIVTTGSLMGVEVAPAGASVEAAVDGVGKVVVGFDRE